MNCWRGGLILVSCCATASWSHAALSQASNATAPAPSSAEANARERFHQGNWLVEQGRYGEALDEFRAAYAAWPNPKIKLNLATTLVALGRNAEGLVAYQQYLREAEPPLDRRREVESVLRDLDQRVARLNLQLGTGVRRVLLDGHELAREGLDDLTLEPGRHVLLAETGSGNKVLAFDAIAGQRQHLALAPDVSTPTPQPRDSIPAGESGSGKQQSGWGLLARVDVDGTGHGAVGAAGLALDLSSHWQLSAGALLGAHAGAWLGSQFAVLDGPLQPTLGLSMPVFFVGTARPGISGELGARWAVSRDLLFLSLRAALVHFPALPASYVETIVVPSLGVEVRL